MDTTRLEVIPDRAQVAADMPSERPLPIRPGVGETIAHRSWTQARKAVLAALLDLPCVVVIAGAPGTGKTLLLADLARALEDAGAAPVLYKRGDLATGPEPMPAERPADTRIVLIDEADRMSDAALARFAAQPGLGLVLAHTDDPTGDARFGAAVGERRLSVVRLEPLTEGETRALLAASLARAGRPADLIGDDALARIAVHSGGVPRLVNMLASAALFLAASESSGQVNAGHVDDAAEMSGLVDRAVADGPPADGEALPSWETEPAADVPEIAPADLAAIAQSWADAAIVAPERAGGAASVAQHLRRAAAPEAPDPPPLRAIGDSRIARPVATRTGGTRHRAAAAAVLLVVSAGAAGWLALHNAGPVATATDVLPTQPAGPPAPPLVAAASPAATPGVAGREPSPELAPPVTGAATSHGKAVSKPADQPPEPGAPSHLALGRPDAQTPALTAEPDSTHSHPSAAVLPPLHAPPALAPRARVVARASPRSPQTSEAEAGRPSRAVHSRAEPQREAGGLLGVLREFSGREQSTPDRDPGVAVGQSYLSGDAPRRPQADPPGGGYVGSYVMGPDGRRMFVQDP